MTPYRFAAGRARSAFAHPPDQRFHVVEVVVERGAPGPGETVLRARCPLDEGLLAADEACFLQATRVDAEVAVRDLEKVLELGEGQSWNASERAHDAEADALVDDAVELCVSFAHTGAHRVWRPCRVAVGSRNRQPPRRIAVSHG